MRIPHGLRAALAGQGGAAPATDSDFENVSLLLHGDGTNGAQNNTFTDGSTNNFTITRNGNTTQGTFSPFSQTGWSGYFDGTGDYLDVPSSSAFAMTGDYTMECWAFPVAQTKRFPLLISLATITIYLQYNHEDAPGKFSLLVGSTRISGSGTQPANAWYHVAAVRSGSTVTLYVNGTSVATLSNSTSYGNSTVKIGGDESLSSDVAYAGYLSNVRIVKGTAVYTSNFTPPTSPLTAITNTSLLTLQDNRFKDNSTNNFTITRNGDARIEAFSPFNPTAAYSASTHGGSGYFDGTGDWLTAASNTAFDVSASAYTFESWIYWTGGTANTTILFGLLGSANSTGYVAAFTDGSTLYWQQVGTGTNETTASFAPVVGQWYHIAIGWNGSNSLAIWINGTRVATNTVTPTSAGQAGVNVGGRSSGNALTGYISNFRLVKGTDVYGVGNSTITVPTAPLTAITNTSLLLNFTNGGIIDNASKNVLETVGNAQISTSVKKFGTGSMYFDGTGDYLKGPSNSLVSWTSENFTIEGWINFIADSNWTTVEKGLDWGLLADANRWVYKANQANVFVISWTPSLNTWYHFACVRNGSTTTMYINGSSIGSGTSVNAASTTAPITVGYSLAFNSYALNGYIDDLRITKGVARYTANFTPPTAAFPDL